MSGERTWSSAVREAQTPWFDYPMNFESDNTILFVFDTFLDDTAIINTRRRSGAINGLLKRCIPRGEDKQ